MFHNFGYEVTDLLKKAEEIRYELRHPYVGTEHLLLALLSMDDSVRSLCQEFGLTYHGFYTNLVSVIGKASKAQEINLYTPMLKRVLELALEDATETNHGVVKPAHLLVAMLEEGDGVAIRILTSMEIDLDDLYDALKENLTVHKKKNNLEIMKIGIHLTGKCKKSTPLVGRDKEVELMIETLLRKQKNNPLLIGKAGVGKTALVEELARRIAQKDVPRELWGMEIYELEMGSLVAGTKYRGEFEERLTKIIKEVIQSKNIIIFIDEIHSMVNAGGAEGAICASDILKPYLARGELKVIGSTTLGEYHEFIAKDKALDRRFEHVLVEEPTKEDMQVILQSVKPVYEKHYHMKLSDTNLQDLLQLSDEYLFSKSNPDKTLDLLDSVCARIKFKKKDAFVKGMELDSIVKKKETFLKQGHYQDALESALKEQELLVGHERIEPEFTMTKEDIVEVIESKTKMVLSKKKEDMLQDLRKNLFDSILGQDTALNTLLDAMDSYKKTGISFLLSGGSGVGKTETVKIVSDTLKTNLLRIDMSEYHLEESINRLIGAPSGYVGYGKDYVFRQLMDQPYTTVLFDEIEKAHPKVLNLLLQILDEGFITDRLGNKIRFDHTYIFLTSNVKCSEKIGFSASMNYQLDRILSKELMGRIDAVIPYQNVGEETVRQYIQKYLKNPDVNIEDLVKNCEYEKYGLRNLRNLIFKYNKKSVNFN